MNSEYSQYEGKQGIVMGVFESGRNFTNTAQVKLDGITQELSQIPIEYLRPIPPSKVSDTVYGLHGDYKGKLMEILDYAREKCIVRIMQSEDEPIRDYHTNQLCKWVQV